MKKFNLPAVLIAIFFCGSVNAQPNKNKLDSVLLENNSLYQFINGVKSFRGSTTGTTLPAFQTLRYDSVWWSYMSAGANKLGVVGAANIAIGVQAFENNTEGKYNTALGLHVLKNNTSGQDNFGTGWDALYNNTTGNANVAIVQDALYNNTWGYNNVALGKGSQYSNKTGHGNISLGYNTLYYTETGSGNVAIGDYAGGFLYNGEGNVFMGEYAGEFNDAAVGKTIRNSVYIGRYSGLSSAHSNSISIGYNTQSSGDNKINIGNTIYGDIPTGDVAAKSFTITGRKITADDNYLYVTTSTGGVKRILLQDISTPITSKVQPLEPLPLKQQPTGFYIYTLSGQFAGYVAKPVYSSVNGLK